MIGGRLVNGHRNYCSIYEAPRCPLIYGSCLSVAPSDENLSILVTFHRQPNTTILHLCCWARSTHKHSRSYSELQWSAPSKLIHFAKRIVPVHRKTSSLQLPVARASRQSNLADARIFSLLVVPRLPVTTSLTIHCRAVCFSNSSRPQLPYRATGYKASPDQSMKPESLRTQKHAENRILAIPTKFWLTIVHSTRVIESILRKRAKYTTCRQRSEKERQRGWKLLKSGIPCFNEQLASS